MEKKKPIELGRIGIGSAVVALITIFVGGLYDGLQHIKGVVSAKEGPFVAAHAFVYMGLALLFAVTGVPYMINLINGFSIWESIPGRSWQKPFMILSFFLGVFLGLDFISHIWIWGIEIGFKSQLSSFHVPLIALFMAICSLWFFYHYSEQRVGRIEWRKNLLPYISIILVSATFVFWLHYLNPSESLRAWETPLGMTRAQSPTAQPDAVRDDMISYALGGFSIYSLFYMVLFVTVNSRYKFSAGQWTLFFLVQGLIGVTFNQDFGMLIPMILTGITSELMLKTLPIFKLEKTRNLQKISTLLPLVYVAFNVGFVYIGGQNWWPLYVVVGLPLGEALIGFLLSWAFLSFFDLKDDCKNAEV